MTIKDLAKETGYSVVTISRVLNNSSRVSKQAREEILRAVEASGFQLNANAKQLKQHANSILVIVKGTSNEMFAEMVVTIQNMIDRTGYPLHVDYMDEDSNEVQRAIRLCVIQMQDYLELDGSSRMNFPGTLSGNNWSWRAKDGFITEDLTKKIRAATELYERL